MPKNRVAFLLILMASILNVEAQSDSSLFKINSSFSALTSNGKLNALYSYANQYGVYDQNYLNQSLLHLQGEATLVKKENYSLDLGVGAVLNNHWNSSFLHELYAKGNLWFIDYTIGKEAYSPLVINDNLSSGLLYWSTNNAPIPRALAGIFNYLPIPYTKGWVEVKGGFGVGVLDDERESYGKSYPLIMDQFFYLRMGNSWIQPYMGLNHSALFGGKDAAGNPIPIDFWATFFARGSAKIGGGEATNAAGGHIGFYDFGLHVKLDNGSAQIYFQKPIRDGSSLYLNHGNNKDFTLGVSAKVDGTKWVKEISIEGFKTTYQSGPGMLDPAYPEGHPKEGQLIFPNEIDDYDAFMKEEFGIEVVGWDQDDFTTYLENTYNHGYEYGGRDNYMNNGYYYAGWSYKGMIMGTPLFHTEKQYESYTGFDYSPRQSFIVNNRITGFHVGLAGDLATNLSYRTKFTVTNNFGTYQDYYQGAMSWNEVPNYFYKGGLMQYYSFIEISERNFLINKFSLRVSLGYDWGELYHTFSTGLTFSYSI